MEEEKDTRLEIILKTILLGILTIVIGISLLFFYGVSKVNASEINIGTCNSFGDAYNTNPGLGGTGQNISWSGGCLVTQLYYNTNVDYYNTARDVTIDFNLEYTTNDAWTKSVNYVVRAGYVTVSGNNLNFIVSSKCTVTYNRTSKDVTTLYQNGKKRSIEGYAVCKDLKNTTEHAYPALRVFRETNPDTTQGHYVGALTGRFYTSYNAVSTSNSSTQYNGPTKQDINNNFNSVINNNNANTENIMNNNNENTDKLRDYDPWEQQNPDSTAEEDLEGMENDLADYMIDDSDINNLNFTIDTNSSQAIWTIFNNVIMSNTLVYTALLTILLLGIIKLILAR